ncbi:MAG: hypothetical protein K6B17_05695 [Treponema sp.]|nr:hypothetical protein [Treponema sp.]
MISLDQVLLLQEKVGTAVEKINSLNAKVLQLESDNDALRRKCAELTNALSEKSELVSSLESTQNKIEQSILLTLNRLDAVENSILTTEDGSAEAENQNYFQSEDTEPSPEEPEVEEIQEQTIPVVQEQPESVTPPPAQNSTLNDNFDIF